MFVLEHLVLPLGSWKLIHTEQMMYLPKPFLEEGKGG